MDPTSITFADLLTQAGVVTAALIVTTLVQLIKGVFPLLDARVSGALMAFILSAVLYVFVGLATGVTSLDLGLTVFLAWLSCATSAVGIKAGIDHATTQSAKADTITDIVDPDVPPEDTSTSGLTGSTGSTGSAGSF